MEITLENFDTLAEERPIQLIDVRSPGEFAAGHVPGAINIPMEQVELRLEDLSKEDVVLLCKSGRRAGMTCEILKNHHPDVKFLAGGTVAWSATGRALVSSQKSRWSLERQVRTAAGTLVLVGVILSLVLHPNWLGLAAFVGGGLTFAGLTDRCAMASLLAKLPWNKARQSQSAVRASN